MRYILKDKKVKYWTVYFDAECLLMTDEELDKHVQDQINKRKKEQEGNWPSAELTKR